MVDKSGDQWRPSFHSPGVSIALPPEPAELAAMESAESVARSLAPELLCDPGETVEARDVRVGAMHDGMSETTRELWAAISTRVKAQPSS